MIKIENVSFTYDKAVSESAVCEINIQIPKGQTILLCGESGSGKTTFGRLINGLIPAYYLAVQLDGKDQGKLTPDGDKTFYEGVDMVWSNTDILIDQLRKIGYEHFEKVELEATAKHEYNL